MTPLAGPKAGVSRRLIALGGFAEYSVGGQEISAQLSPTASNGRLQALPLACVVVGALVGASTGAEDAEAISVINLKASAGRAGNFGRNDVRIEL